MKISEYIVLKSKRHAIVSEIDAALILALTDPGKALAALFRAAMGLKWVSARIMGDLIRRSKGKPA